MGFGVSRVLERAPSGCIIGPMPTSELRSWRNAPWRAAIGAGLDLLLPPVCIACRVRIGSHGLVCGACFAKIDFIAPPICERLGVPLPFDTGAPSLSAAAIAAPPVYDRARAVARYSETMRDLIQSQTIVTARRGSACSAAGSPGPEPSC
jgi:hypothetical protein